MADHLWVPGHARDFIAEVAHEDLSRETRLTLFGLLGDPVPPDARVLRVDGEDLEGHYELDVGGIVTVLYVVDGEHVMVQSVGWRRL